MISSSLLPSSSSSLSFSIPDPLRPLSLAAVEKGWYGTFDDVYDYWIPRAQIEGKIPDDLIGTVFKNGPGINRVYDKELVHPIDGDGMIVRISFTRDGIHFKNKFVETHSHKQEKTQKKFIYRGQMGTQPHSWIYNTVSFLRYSLIGGESIDLNYRNPSNTNVVYFGDKLLSFYETNLPMTLDPITLNTISNGIGDNFNGENNLNAMAAHFRFDSINNLFVCFSLRPSLKSLPHLHIYEYYQNFQLKSKKIYRIPGLNYSHDFVLTPNYYIFHITPFVNVTPSLVSKIAMGISSPGEQMKYYSDLPSKFVIIPRNYSPSHHQDFTVIETKTNQKNSNKKISTPSNSSFSSSNEIEKFAYKFSNKLDPFHIFHFGTAYERINDDGETIIDFCAVTLGEKFTMKFENNLWLSNATEAPGFMSKFSLNVKTGECKREISDRASMEFPASHPSLNGLKSRYNYCMSSDRFDDKGKLIAVPFRDIVKYDMNHDNKQRKVWMSHGVIGEPIFIPKYSHSSTAPSNSTLDNYSNDEDDGYLFVQVFVPEINRTEFCILSSRSMHLLARIKLLHHLPFAFHGTYTPHTFIQRSNTDSHYNNNDRIKSKL